jgi:hypothetical protein
MNLPFILDIGIGLFFIYLTLSLIASELQELLTTLFQWRAQHLKQSIETLLAGDSKPKLNEGLADAQLIQSQIDRSKELANSLYNHPLIRSLDHESNGLLGRVAERVSQWTKASKTFAGKASGPSYLPSETFSTTLLETLKIGELIQTLSECKLTQCVDAKLVQPVFDVINDLRHGAADELLLKHELQTFQTEVHEIMQTFGSQQATLSSSFNQIFSAAKRFRLTVEAVLPETNALSHVCLKRLAAIEQELPGLLTALQPSVVEVVSALSKVTWVAQTLQKPNGDVKTIVAQLPDITLQQRFQGGYELLQTMKQVIQVSSQGREDFQATLTQLSPNLLDSLTMLARRSQAKISALDQGANQLQQEVALWFDRSMDRSAGVYKRNAKGVALIMGFLIAVMTNTDTLHVINRLAQDSALRATYSQAASALVSSNPNAIACLQTQQGRAAQADCLNNGALNLRQAIASTTDLPIGWNDTNWQEQWHHPQGTVVSGLKILAGWLVSAIAISMGAPFWFNLLNKVVNVRNSGKPPVSTS